MCASEAGLSPEDTAARLQTILPVALQHTKDNDKVRASIVRALGLLARLLEPATIISTKVVKYCMEQKN